MATDKKFSVVGVSTLNGKTKIRFANDSMRIKILLKNGHEDVDMINLDREMYKWEIAEHLKAVDFAKGNPATKAAIDYIAKKNPTPKGEDAPAETNQEEAVEPVVA
jgi:hypothetical protein